MDPDSPSPDSVDAAQMVSSSGFRPADMKHVDDREALRHRLQVVEDILRYDFQKTLDEKDAKAGRARTIFVALVEVVIWVIFAVICLVVLILNSITVATEDWKTDFETKTKNATEYPAILFCTYNAYPISGRSWVYVADLDWGPVSANIFPPRSFPCPADNYWDRCMAFHYEDDTPDYVFNGRDFWLTIYFNYTYAYDAPDLPYFSMAVVDRREIYEYEYDKEKEVWAPDYSRILPIRGQPATLNEKLSDLFNEHVAIYPQSSSVLTVIATKEILEYRGKETTIVPEVTYDARPLTMQVRDRCPDTFCGDTFTMLFTILNNEVTHIKYKLYDWKTPIVAVSSALGGLNSIRLAVNLVALTGFECIRKKTDKKSRKKKRHTRAISLEELRSDVHRTQAQKEGKIKTVELDWQ